MDGTVGGLTPAAKAGASAARAGRAAGAGRGDAAKQARQDGDDAVRKVAEQFAALFVQQILKTARPSPGRGFLGGGIAGEVYGDMFLQVMAEKVAAGGLGLAEILARQFSGIASAPASPDPVRQRRDEVRAGGKP